MKQFRPDRGNVIVEFIGITIALLVPLSIIASSSIMVANAYLSTDVSARIAARAYVLSSNDASGTRAANSAAGLSSQDFDSQVLIRPIKVSCTKNPCLSPGGFVTVRVSKEVNLNLPKALGSRSVVVSAQHTAVVDELRTP
jgi:hypothetical protein